MSRNRRDRHRRPDAADDRRPCDAAHRRGRTRHRPGEVHGRRPAAGDALRARAAQPASARAHRSIDVSKARALPGVKAVLTHENCKVVWGAGSVAGGMQYNDEIKKITKQRRYAFNNPVRFVGEPVAAVAAVDRHVAEEALQLIAVDYEVLPFVLDPEDALKPDAPKIWPEGNLALNDRNEAQPIGADARQRRRRLLAAAAHVFEDRYTTAFVHNAQMEPRVARRALGRRQADRLHADRRHRQLPHTTSRATSAFPHEKVRVVCQYMGGNFGNKNQNQDADLIAAMLAKEAGAPVKLELSRKEDFIGMHGRWPTMQYYKVGVDARRHAARRSSCAASAAWAATARTRGAIGGHRAVQVPEHRDRRHARLHQQDRVGELPRPGVSAGLLRHPVDDGRRRVQAEDGPGRVRR